MPHDYMQDDDFIVDNLPPVAESRHAFAIPPIVPGVGISGWRSARLSVIAYGQAKPAGGRREPPTLELVIDVSDNHAFCFRTLIDDNGGFAWPALKTPDTDASKSVIVHLEAVKFDGKPACRITEIIDPGWVGRAL